MCINEEDGRMDEMINGQKDGWGNEWMKNEQLPPTETEPFSKFCFPQIGCSHN